VRSAIILTFATVWKANLPASYSPRSMGRWSVGRPMAFPSTRISGYPGTSTLLT